MATELRLTKRAFADLDAIAEYTEENFGPAQAKRYREGLSRAFNLLVAFPHMGADQSHVRPAVRRHVHESHAIYYRLDGETIVIQRLLGPGHDPMQEPMDEGF